MKTSTNAMTANTQTIKFFTFDHVHKQIIGSQFNFDKSGIFGTDQYAALMIAMEKHPNYELFPVAPIKEKQTYQGLNKPFMDKYIQAVATEAIKAEYKKWCRGRCPHQPACKADVKRARRNSRFSIPQISKNAILRL